MDNRKCGRTSLDKDNFLGDGYILRSKMDFADVFDDKLIYEKYIGFFDLFANVFRRYYDLEKSIMMLVTLKV